MKSKKHTKNTLEKSLDIATHMLAKYEVPGKLWGYCFVCNTKIRVKENHYTPKHYFDIFQKHLQEDHKLSITDYFIKYSNDPVCWFF